MTWIACALAVPCLLSLLRTALVIRLRIPLNFNEGWNAFHSADVVAGRPLYPDSAGFYFNNYPPLSFYPVAAVGHVGGDQVFGGRIVALLALVAWTVLLALAARRLRCAWAESSFAALLFAAQLWVFSDFYVGVDDPQVLGHALQAAGLVVLLGGRRSGGRLFATALLFTLGVFTKQNLIALPMATVIWLALDDRPSAWRLTAFGGLLGAAGLTVCVALFGTAFVGQVGAARGYIAAKGLSMSLQWAFRMAVFLAVAAVLAARRIRGDSSTGFALTYSAVAILIGAGMSGGDGVYWNILFDAEWALCLTAAVALNRLAPLASPIAPRARSALAAAYLAAPAIALAATATIHWLSPRFWLDPRWSEAGTAAREIAFIKEHPGPALCENLVICYWAGKSVEVDFFNLQQRISKEPWRSEAVAREIESRRFAVAVVDAPGRDLGPAVTGALSRYYAVDHQSQWGRYLVPKSGHLGGIEQPPGR